MQQSGADEATVGICYQRARTIAQRQSAKSLELRAALALCRLWMKRGKTDAARQLLQPLYDWFTEGFATPDLIEAKDLLAALAKHG